MDLETILQKLGGYTKVFKKDGTLSIKGNEAYGKLITLLENLRQVGVITTKECDKIISKLDKICDEQ